MEVCQTLLIIVLLASKGSLAIVPRTSPPWGSMGNMQEYELLELEKINERLLEWPGRYPDLIRLTTAQEAYGLPQAGGPRDCPFDDGDGCKNYIVTIQDYVAHPELSESSQRLPEVLWSGEVHGDERVGPTAVLEAAQLLLDATTCESLPRVERRPKQVMYDTKVDEVWKNELSEAYLCRQMLEDRYGVNAEHRQWLARLVSTRRIVIVPTANALGYSNDERKENGIDPNRDFPYQIKNSSDCMKSIAARTLNEVFRDHLFQLALTFHCCKNSISYEWGAPKWGESPSPDDTAQAQIAELYSLYAGSWPGMEPYEVGKMNSIVYPVKGGMEDWAYAGSWDTKRVIQCQPTINGEYPADKTSYNNSTLRVFNTLIETGFREGEYGTSLNVTSKDLLGTGSVPTNMRLALMSLELVEPYVQVTQINDMRLEDDIVPLMERSGRTCQTNRVVSVPLKSNRASVNWVVGGSLEISNVQLWYGKWGDVPTSVLNCTVQPTKADIETHMMAATMNSATSGSGKFSRNGPCTVFSGSIDLSDFSEDDSLVVIASARVDESWSTQPKHYKPKVLPQAHVVNARTNPDWYHEIPGSIVQGRLYFFSIPVTLQLVREYDGQPLSKTIEQTWRFSNQTAPPATSSNQTGALVVLILVAMLAGFALQKWHARRSLNSSHQQGLQPVYRDDIEDEFDDGVEMRRYTDKPVT